MPTNFGQALSAMQSGVEKKPGEEPLGEQEIGDILDELHTKSFNLSKLCELLCDQVCAMMDSQDFTNAYQLSSAYGCVVDLAKQLEQGLDDVSI